MPQRDTARIYPNASVWFRIGTNPTDSRLCSREVADALSRLSRRFSWRVPRFILPRACSPCCSLAPPWWRGRRRGRARPGCCSPPWARAAEPPTAASRLGRTSPAYFATANKKNVKSIRIMRMIPLKYDIWIKKK